MCFFTTIEKLIHLCHSATLRILFGVKICIVIIEKISITEDYAEYGNTLHSLFCCSENMNFKSFEYHKIQFV